MIHMTQDIIRYLIIYIFNVRNIKLKIHTKNSMINRMNTKISIEMYLINICENFTIFIYVI